MENSGKKCLTLISSGSSNAHTYTNTTHGSANCEELQKQINEKTFSLTLYHWHTSLISIGTFNSRDTRAKIKSMDFTQHTREPFLPHCIVWSPTWTLRNECSMRAIFSFNWTFVFAYSSASSYHVVFLFLLRRFYNYSILAASLSLYRY